jgi:hypothetical protein
MTKTKYYDLQMDDPQDDYDVEVVNANLKKIDEQMKTREKATDALQEPEFTVAAKRENIASKEKMPKILGKIAKFFADLKTVAFSGKYNDLDGKPAIVNNNTTTEPGSALDARQANPNIEGTMAASIAQINNDLKSEGNPNCVLTNATGELLNYKYGNISMISIEANLTKIEHGLIVGTGIYAPVRNIYLSLTMIDGTNVPMLLSTLGELSVYYPYQNHTSVARIDGCFSYICA